MDDYQIVKVFVYGTFKRGYRDYFKHFFRKSDVVFCGCAETVHPMSLYDMGPAPFVLKKGEPVAKIKGELFALGPKSLYAIDRFHGYPYGYDRLEIPVLLEDGTEINGFIHVIDEETKIGIKCCTAIVCSGCWREGIIEYPEMLESNFNPKDLLIY